MEELSINSQKSLNITEGAHFRLSYCGRFGCVVRGERVLRWIASREKGITFAREASVCETVLSLAERDDVVRQILAAPHLPMMEEHVEGRIQDEVKNLNRKLEEFGKIRDEKIRLGMLRHAEEVDAEITLDVLAARPPYQFN